MKRETPSLCNKRPGPWWARLQGCSFRASWKMGTTFIVSLLSARAPLIMGELALDS